MHLFQGKNIDSGEKKKTESLDCTLLCNVSTNIVLAVII